MAITETERFRTEILHELSDAVITGSAGGIREEKFTEMALDLLEEAGETEGARPCREIKENRIGNRIHKINGYAISEGFETIDLFITVFGGGTEQGRLYADDLRTATSLSTRFLQSLLSGKITGVEDTAPVSDFLRTIKVYANQVVRANIYVLSDLTIPLDPPASIDIGETKVHYHLRDIEYLYRIHSSGTGKETIIIDFVHRFGESLPCLAMPHKNADYESFLCVIPAGILADIYQDHGARLLEQNVRTFLQFRGNINKGIRDTILKESHMFMAYNNGISATAESIILADDGHSIISINDFQIVNGGQTTASIFQTRRKYRGAALDQVQAQLKLTVVKNQSKKSEIVSMISRYANTQNKVSEADLSSNHPFHIEIEQFSRKLWTTAAVGKIQSRWYYERARGQYNDELSQIDSRAQQQRWLDRNPKDKKFAKEDLARFYISWEMQPWWVVKGRQKNFVEFMKIADDLEVTSIFYEDLIAKAILFRAAETIYGTGGKSIGDLRYMVVPYSIAWLNLYSQNRLNLSKIWKRQEVSSELKVLLKLLLLHVDNFMRETAPGGLIGEWAKKDECWKVLKKRNFELDLSAIKSDIYTIQQFDRRYKTSIVDSSALEITRQKVLKLGADGWIRIDQWGRISQQLSTLDSNWIWKIVRKVEGKSILSEKDLSNASRILDQVSRHTDLDNLT
jgi:hypothetical protein